MDHSTEISPPAETLKHEKHGAGAGFHSKQCKDCKYKKRVSDEEGQSTVYYTQMMCSWNHCLSEKP